MKVNFLIIFLLAMVLIISASIVTTYTTIRASQKNYEQEMLSFKEMLKDNADFQKKLSLYKAFSEKEAIDTTRRVMAVFFIEIAIMAMLSLYFIYGVTRPINQLSAQVKSIYFDKTEQELLMPEAGTEEVRVLVRAFNGMVVKLKNYEKILGNINKYRGWKEISRIIVHEINNIISPIQTYVEFLMDKTGETEKLSFILTKLNDIRDVLQKFRGISHLPDAAIEMKDIVPVVNEVCKEFKNANCSMNGDKKIMVKIDTVLFKEILRNLIKNAVEAGENVSVTVEVLDGPAGKMVVVKDNGSGMSPETIQKIFEPGYSTKKGKGNVGIGLSVVKSLSQEQNARIDLESKPGEGTTFRIIFMDELIKLK